MCASAAADAILEAIRKSQGVCTATTVNDEKATAIILFCELQSKAKRSKIKQTANKLCTETALNKAKVQSTTLSNICANSGHV